MRGNSNSDKILIFDWDETITNQHMHDYIHDINEGVPKSDYGSSENRAVTVEDIKGFLRMEGSGIKNEKQLKSVLQKALEQGVIFAIASLTSYRKEVEYVVQNHLGLSEKQAESIKIVGGYPRAITYAFGKNLHILIHILDYLEKHKAKYNDALPKEVEVMLVDDDPKNVECIKKFNIQISELLEFIKDKKMQDLLKIDSKIINTQITAEDLEKIDFKLKGAQVPKDPITEISEEDKKKKHYDYLDQVERWVEKKKVHFNDEVEVRDITQSHSTEASNKQEAKQTSNAQQHHKPQLWKKGVVLTVPAVVGLIAFGSLAVTGAVSLSTAVAIGVLIAVVAYALEEFYLEPEFKPSSILTELREVIKNSFAREEKTQYPFSEVGK
ncbi:hypothetical protein [Wolbachia endosymbiont of Folsomia candida]|uniref:hypothetical protein n=1 Tax=Wolbachia endosymbiont of Folsomia candida TaxID=169402 RepID=UPI000B2E7F76|nr:hypothetical protein [Wolbachia endosymbiont of Folsomia candida]APR97760.1 hypothetical protein ASM33_00155 [Wolbachia endosymbiont of Folsomia candida]